MECQGGQGTFVGSALTPGLIGSQPQPTLQVTPSPGPGQVPGKVPQLLPSKLGMLFSMLFYFVIIVASFVSSTRVYYSCISFTFVENLNQ